MPTRDEDVWEHATLLFCGRCGNLEQTNGDNRDEESKCVGRASVS